jgi:hypothetical protein
MPALPYHASTTPLTLNRNHPVGLTMARSAIRAHSSVRLDIGSVATHSKSQSGPARIDNANGYSTLNSHSTLMSIVMPRVIPSLNGAACTLCAM